MSLQVVRSSTLSNIYNQHYITYFYNDFSWKGMFSGSIAYMQQQELLIERKNYVLKKFVLLTSFITRIKYNQSKEKIYLKIEFQNSIEDGVSATVYR